MTDRGAESERIRDQALDLVLKLATRPDDDGVRGELEAWRRQSPAHDRAYRVAAEAWLLGGSAEKAEALDGATAPHARHDGIAPSPRRPVRRAALFLVSAAAVAGIALWIGPTVRLQIEADHLTGVGEMRSVELEDGSTLHLDAESAVAVAYSPTGRSVELLAGNAFFEVRRQPDRPFLVDAAGLRVEVTGTAFAVSQGSESTTVAVQSGSVDVTPERPSGMTAILETGDRLILDGATGALRRGKVSPTEIAAWRRGLILADRMPFGDLARALDRHHRGVIWVASGTLAQGDVTGVFDLRDPVTALTAAADTQNADVTQVSPFLLVVTPR